MDSALLSLLGAFLLSIIGRPAVRKARRSSLNGQCGRRLRQCAGQALVPQPSTPMETLTPARNPGANPSTEPGQLQ